MKPASLAQQLECDDGIFNVGWVKGGRIRQVECEWRTPGGASLPCGRVSKKDPVTEIVGNYWCVECGLVVCLKHRLGHAAGSTHEKRLEKWRERLGE